MNKITLLFCFVLILSGCTSTFLIRNQHRDIAELTTGTGAYFGPPFLKVHMKNGELYVLNEDWKLNVDQKFIFGKGTRYSFNRKQYYVDSFQIQLDSVALFETNNKLKDPKSEAVQMMGFLGTIDLAMACFCMINPKACFGSCPTFYMKDVNDIHASDAEGFSSAVAPWLEYADLDDLKNIPAKQDTFTLFMKNEAFETHCVNDVKVLAFPRDENKHVYQSPQNTFFQCLGRDKLLHAKATEGDVSMLLSESDLHERFSLADSKNMNSREEITLDFGRSNLRNPGLVIDFRQTMMSTYLFYSAMGYMGDEVGMRFAKMERSPFLQKKFKEINGMLGGIDIYVWNEKKHVWDFQNKVHELGPIAVNRQLVPLNVSNGTSELKIKLVLNKGTWRLDQVFLTDIVCEVQPSLISANRIEHNGISDPSALSKINDPKQYLISMPGDEFKFYFKMPDSNSEYELFLYSKGYYMEWMRSEWIKEKDSRKLIEMVMTPKIYFRKEAQNYKKYEESMESIFWSSRIDTKAYKYFTGSEK
jgi:hypothetical protein